MAPINGQMTNQTWRITAIAINPAKLASIDKVALLSQGKNARNNMNIAKNKSGVRQNVTPMKAAIPFPPRYLSQKGNKWPRTTAKPATAISQMEKW